MPRLIPAEPKFASDAEELVWQHLTEQLPDDATLIAGQRITAGGKEIEIDLLVLWPQVGAAVLEVKGGRVDIAKGVWRQSGRRGTHALDPSPIAQAQRAKHQLLEWLNSRSSRRLGRTVHLAVLPYTTLPAEWDVPDAPRALTLDSTDLPDLADRIAVALRDQHAGHYGPLDAEQAEHSVTLLRRTHAALENHRVLAGRLESTGNALTREQERTITLLRWQDRAQIIGGAGSGKTHLAMIKARRLTAAGRRTALMCYSRGLARHFELLATQWPADERPAYVGLFHDLPVRWGAPAEPAAPVTGSGYYEDYLPRRLADLASAQAPEERFDAIVVDEAQDFSDLWWDGLCACLRDPERGVLFVCTDRRQAVFDREGTAPITLSPFQLEENLRNSADIAAVFSPLTGLRQRARLGAGDPVRWVDAAPDAVIDAADDAVEDLIDQGWCPGDIALLTTGRRHPEQRSRIDFGGYDGYWDDFFAGNDVFYGHVLNFKGLERSAVVLAVNGFQSPERAAGLLYVGLSRARSHLVVVGPADQLRAAGGPEVARRITGLG